MCGRFSLTKAEQTINDRFQTSGGAIPYIPRFNGAPGQNQVVITNQEPGKLSSFRWGLIPFWANDPAIGNKLINAKSETAHQKPSFREAFKKRRCLVISDGFFEWKKWGKDKVPHYIMLPGHQLFAMAGLWETWKNDEGEPIHTFTILTTEPNETMQSIHHRMPVILPEKEEMLWLESDDPKELQSIMKPYPQKMDLYPVSKLVNSPRNDVAEIIRPAEGYSGSLF